MSQAPVILVEWRGQGVVLVTLNRPKQGNAINARLRTALITKLDELRNNIECRVLVLTGQGKYFCTGMDLVQGDEEGESSTTSSDDTLAQSKELFRAVDTFPKPVIGLLNGPSYGGGVGLALCTDIRIATSEKASFHLPEVHRGLVPALISQYLLREMGPAQARSAMLTGLPLTPSKLLAAGVIHEIIASDGDTAPELSSVWQAVQRWVEQLIKGAPLAQSRVKDLVRAASSSDDGPGSQAAMIKEVFTEMMAPSDEAVEGITHFQRTKGKTPVDWVSFHRNKAKL